MTRNDSGKKATRLICLREALEHSPGGLTTRELAALLGVNVRSAQRYVQDLQDSLGLPIERAGSRYRLDSRERLRPVAFSLDEAVAIYLAARLYLRHAEYGNRADAGALKKLAASMPEPVAEFVDAGAAQLERRKVNSRYNEILQTITYAWANRRVLRLSYQSAHSDRPKPIVVEPYFLEPLHTGFATYLIARSRTHDDIRVFKVERVRTAQVLPEVYEIPAGMTPDALLRNAWGIAFKQGNADQVKVVLRFDASVASRVQESEWHPSQSVRKEAEGGLRFEVTLGSTMEILPWIRSWGDAVEVLEPPDLREQVADGARRAASRYGGGRHA